MAKIQQLKERHTLENIYPITKTNVVFDNEGNTLDSILSGKIGKSELNKAVSNILGDTVREVEDIPEMKILASILAKDPIGFIKTIPNAAQLVEELDPDIIAITNHSDSKFNVQKRGFSATPSATTVYTTDEKGILRFSNLLPELQTNDKTDKEVWLQDVEECYYLNLKNFERLFFITKWSLIQKIEYPKYKLKLLSNVLHTENIKHLGNMNHGLFGAHYATLGGRELPYEEGLIIDEGATWDLTNSTDSTNDNTLCFVFAMPGNTSYNNNPTPFILGGLPKNVLINPNTMYNMNMFCSNVWSPNYPNLDLTGLLSNRSGFGTANSGHLISSNTFNGDYFTLVYEKGLDKIEQSWVCKGLGWRNGYSDVNLRNIVNWKYQDMIDSLINYSLNRTELGYNSASTGGAGYISLWEKSYDKLTKEDLAAISAKGYSVKRITL